MQFLIGSAGAAGTYGCTSTDRSRSQRKRMLARTGNSECDCPELQALPRRAVADGADPLRGERGFTLLELLVVLAILGLLVGLVAPAALRQLGSAKEKIAHQSIERLAGVLDIYKLDIGSYPTTEQGLQSLITQPPGVARWNGPYM